MKRVLIIEDEPNIVEAITYLLEREKLLVLAHRDGMGALRKIAAVKPDIVVLDVMLPNQSGFDIIRRIRASDEFPDLPVLMLTAKGQAKDRESALAAGVDRFMTKPFSNQAVVDTVLELLEGV